MTQLRRALPQSFPGTDFAFLPADIVSQILNFGAPAPIDLQVAGPDVAGGEAYARKLAAEMRHVAGIADVRVQQSSTYPQLNFTVDRSQADRLGITARDVTNSLAVNLGGSLQTAPAFWLNPKNGVSYPIVVQTPEYRVDTVNQVDNLPVTGSRPGSYQILGGLGAITRGPSPAVISHYAIAPVFDVYATLQGRDLGAVAADINTIIRDHAAGRPKGATVTLRGQVETMNTAFSGLEFGLLGAVVLIYLLIVVNFQSWIDPLIIVSALPAALAGIVWMLFATHTPLSVPALTGAIMCMGVATANSVLVISFARDRLAVLGDGVRAAVEAGSTRFRPVHHDGARDDHRHGADGARHGRRRRAERPARPRRHRRAGRRDDRHAAVRPRPVQPRAPQAARRRRAHRRPRLCRLRCRGRRGQRDC